MRHQGVRRDGGVERRVATIMHYGVFYGATVTGAGRVSLGQTVNVGEILWCAY